MALLRLLQEIKLQLGGAGQLIALHVNHQLRGDESSADAQWCQQQCDQINVPLEVITCDTAKTAAESGEGIEAAARNERYQRLTAAAEQTGVRYLAVAHTCNDQAETVLFRILRGTGLRGLAGIPRTRALTTSLTLIRPLLDCSREMVTDYLKELQQDYRTDSSNSETRFTRNRLRHELLPLLREQYNLDLDGALVRLAAQAEGAKTLVEEQARLLLDRAKMQATGSSVSLCWSAFAGCEQTLVCEALRLAWREAGLAEQAMTYQWWTQLAELMQQPCDDTVFNLPGNVRASITGDRLTLEW